MSRIFNYDQIHFNHQNNVDNLIKIAYNISAIDYIY